jgi:hypothetical protein
MKFIPLILALTCASSVQGALILNEIFVNIPTSAGGDNGGEFFEIRSTTGGVESLSGLTFLVIEGDGPTASGVIDVAISLSGFTTGPNGLFLWRDSAPVIDISTADGVQGPEAGTTLNVADFNPDLENGTNTYLIVSGFTGAVGNDLDTNGDGTIDIALPWTSVIDAVGVLETDAGTNLVYGSQLGFFDFALLSFTPDAVFRDSAGIWQAGDIVGNSLTGPFGFDGVQNTFGAGPLATLTPGATNIPEPGVTLLGVFGVLGLLRRRR